jgi:hypothetical protein
VDCKRQEVYLRPSEGRDGTAGRWECSLWTQEGREQGGSRKEVTKIRVGPEKRERKEVSKSKEGGRIRKRG